MSKSNKQVVFIVVAFLVIHLVVLAADLITNKLPFYIVFLNLMAGLSVIIYWIQKQIRITQHSIEFREMIFLVIESLIVGISVYYILSSPLNHWIKVVQYIIFGLHWILTLLALVFMLTFRIKRLF